MIPNIRYVIGHAIHMEISATIANYNSYTVATVVAV